MYSNYIASEVPYEDMGENWVIVEGIRYTWDPDMDPEYQDDGILNISYWGLYKDDELVNGMVLAFDRTDTPIEDCNEWSDMYDFPYVLAFR